MSDRGRPIFAWFYSKLAGYEEKRGLGELRDEVVRPAEGTVLEIGAGTGLNFAHYPQGVTVVATEPDPHMLKRAVPAAANVGVERKPIGAAQFLQGDLCLRRALASRLEHDGPMRRGEDVARRAR